MTMAGEMTAKELDEALAAIARRAKDLREAGVVGQVSIGEIEFELAASEPAQPVMVQPGDESRGSPLDDPATFGGDDIPRRRQPRQRPPEFEE